MPSWTKPEVTEIKMDAEIGSYQLDDDERPPQYATPEQPPDDSRVG